MRRIAVVTVGRSDYGIYLPILRRLRDDPEVSMSLLAGGMHLSPAHGHTVEMIEADGFVVDEKIESYARGDSPADISRAIGAGVAGFSRSFASRRPDILVVLGDRYEMYAAALAALPFGIPVAHIHGGELTLGAFDDALRHSMTKLSHLHFVATEAYARRVIQLGEEPWRVTISGAPGLDNLDAVSLLSREEVSNAVGMDFGKPTLLVTFHPVTLEYQSLETQVEQVFSAVEASGVQALFSLPNADTGGSFIADRIRRTVEANPHFRLVENMGTQVYFSAMKHAAAMVGNSSSGIIEAPSFELPVVNIGLRQAGRLRCSNVIDTVCDKREILDAIYKALQPEFAHGLRGMVNHYRKANSAEIIVEHLKSVTINGNLMLKRFYDLDTAP